MLNTIVVPLDGSALAEQALPYSVRLANELKAHLLLVRITGLKADLNNAAEQQTEFITHAEFYLNGIQRTLTNPSLTPYLPLERVQTLATYGNPANEIVRIAASREASLIVMSTHGHTGTGRNSPLGSVATQVIKQTKLPVILIRPPKINNFELLIDTLAEEPAFYEEEVTHQRLLVTLDGTSEAETALEPAIKLAQQLRASIYLLRVVPLFSSLVLASSGEPGKALTYVIDRETAANRARAYQYLEIILAQIPRKGLICFGEVRIGKPVEEITEYARKVGASLILMASHVRGKGEFLGTGSVTEEVMQASHLPVMIMPPASPFQTDHSSWVSCKRDQTVLFEKV